MKSPTRSTKVVAVVAGTRPEVIKMAPVYQALTGCPKLKPLFISTGQHKQMLEQSCLVFGIKPHIDLKLMRRNQTLSQLTARIVTSATETLRQLKPAAVLVQGDTTTVLGVALAAFYEHIPIGHVEAGLRTRNLLSPWPEEMNRRLTDPISEWCFAPTEGCRSNLIGEGISKARIHVTGNTVVDALLNMSNRLATTAKTGQMASQIGLADAFCKDYLQPGSQRNGEKPPLILMTGHRRESFGAGFNRICTAVRRLIERNPDWGIIYPVHLNPNVQRPVHQILGGHPRIQLIEPIGYEHFVWLMTQCRFILSDSGGVQEEAPSLGKPVLVLRDTTERPEGVNAGTCRLVGTNVRRIIEESEILIRDKKEYSRRSALANPYGDGHAAQRIVSVLKQAIL